MAYVNDETTALLLHLDGSAEDSSKAKLHGKAEGITWSENGIIGKAAVCNSKSNLTIPAPDFGEFIDGFTIEAWVKLERPDKSVQYGLVSLKDMFNWYVQSYNEWEAKIFFEVNTEKGIFSAKTAEVLPYGKWFHIACVYNPAGGAEALNILIHGTSVEKWWSYDERQEVSGTLCVGKGHLIIGQNLSGMIDEMRISKMQRSVHEMNCAWLSRCGGEFIPFKPDVRALAMPDAWDTKNIWLTDVQAIPTFNSIGIYACYEGDDNGNAVCRVRYRKKNDSTWMQGMELIPDREDRQFRGSLLMLNPGTIYEVELSAIDPDINDTTKLKPLLFSTRTWNEEVQIGEVRELPEFSQEQFIINAMGKPDAWILYCPPKGKKSVIDGGTTVPQAVLVEDSAYVVFQNITVRGGSRDSLHIMNSHHIRIQRCEFSNWGKRGVIGPDGRYVDENGVHINEQVGIRIGIHCSQVVVEDNYIHSPNATARSWKYGHPKGPCGVVTTATDGNNVIRNNEIIGDEEHWWNDALTSFANSSVTGGPYRDTDIYSNIFLFADDDCVELDGGQMNVRFWDNRLETGVCQLSCAPSRKGPCYIFRNLMVYIGDDRGDAGAAFKMGGGKHYSPGLDLILHNTIYGTGNGISSVGYGRFKDSARYRTFSRNNLFAGPESAGRRLDVYDKFKDKENDYDYDLLSRQGASVSDGNEEHAVRKAPVFVDAAGGDFRLIKSSPGIDAGVVLPGINDEFTGKSPDIGAFEAGCQAVIPSRASGIVARPQRIELNGMLGNGLTEPIEIELIVPKKAGQKWIAYPNSEWIVCEPVSSTTVDVPQKVKIRCKTDGLENRFYRGAVTFRTDLGFNTTITVFLKVYCKPFVKLIEAEASEISGGFKKQPEKNASRGIYLSVPPKVGEKKPEEGMLVFNFEVPNDGTYYVAGRCQVPKPCGSHDSFFVSMDDGEHGRWDVFAGPYQWSWTMLNKHEEEATTVAYPFRLSKGKHKLIIISRELDTRLDCIAITNNPYPEYFNKK